MEKYLNNPQQEFFQKVTIKKTGIISQKNTCKMHITQK